MTQAAALRVIPSLKRYLVDVYVGPSPTSSSGINDSEFITVEVEAVNPLHAQLIARNMHNASVAMRPRLVKHS